MQQVKMRHAINAIGMMFLSAIVACNVAFSQTPDSAAAPSPVVVGGFVDTYFSYNFDRPTSHTNQLRNFDVTENQFKVANAEVSMTKAAAPVGFRADLDFGPTNDLVQTGDGGSLANVGQAYVTYVAPVGSGLTLDAGKFVTHMGMEVIKAKDDYNYSRSFLFAYSIPYYHYGVRASYPVSSTLTLCAHILDNYNGPAVHHNGKTFGFQAVFTPTSALSLTANYIGGPNPADSVSKKFRNVANVMIMYQATEKLGLSIDAVYGQDNRETGGVNLWKGAAAYIRYALCDPSVVTLRGEIYSDPEGATTSTTQELREVTLTYEYKVASSLILRGEYRYDWSDATGVVKSFDGDSGPLTRSNQATLGVGAIVVF
jgi:Putative beta-barrel porin-2, OmpL-like. bbp2